MTDLITTCLWFDDNGEEAAEFYCSVLPNSKVVSTTPYAEGTDRAGQVLTVDFVLDGRPYLALNGGPQHRFNEAISFQIACENQAEVDHYWDALLAGGGVEDQCGWVKDRFGLSWQVVPTVMPRLFSGDKDVAARVMQAMFTMKKLDIAALEAAAADA